MAATGFTPISLYYSTTASAVPTSGNLANGELGLNIADMKLYAKNSAGTVTLLASNAGASGSVTSVSGTGTVNGLTLTGTVTTSGSLTLGGTLSLVSPPPIGSSTPNTGAFTTLSATSDLTLPKLSIISDSPFYTGGNISSGVNALGIGTTGAAFIGFFTNNLQRFVFGTAGQFGVGATPDYGTAGQVLTSAGSGAAPTWATVSSLPSQTGNSGKYLTTDGTNASWATVSGGATKGQAIAFSLVFGF